MLLGWHYRWEYANDYGANQYLASRGFIVLSVDYRLSVGYGKSFQFPDNTGARGATEYRDILAGGKYLQSRPDVDPARKPGTGKRAEFCPGAHGGKTWPPIAFSPQTRMIYVPANTNLCGAMMGAAEVTYRAGAGFTGTQFGAGPTPTVPGADHYGEVQAWNVDTGQRVWTHTYARSPNWGAMLATAGGLVFTGGTNDRKIHAFDAATGTLLWEWPTSSGILAPPTSFGCACANRRASIPP